MARKFVGVGGLLDIVSRIHAPLSICTACHTWRALRCHAPHFAHDRLPAPAVALRSPPSHQLINMLQTVISAVMLLAALGAGPADASPQKGDGDGAQEPPSASTSSINNGTSHGCSHSDGGSGSGGASGEPPLASCSAPAAHGREDAAARGGEGGGLGALARRMLSHIPRNSLAAGAEIGLYTCAAVALGGVGLQVGGVGLHVSDCRWEVSDCRCRTAGGKCRTAGVGLQVGGVGLQVSDCRWEVSDCKCRTAGDAGAEMLTCVCGQTHLCGWTSFYLPPMYGCNASGCPCPVPRAPCPGPLAPCPGPLAPGPLPLAPGPLPRAPCPVPFAHVASGLNVRRVQRPF
eukprot:354166-Chlamydomonas_euryale.AAC.1